MSSKTVGNRVQQKAGEIYSVWTHHEVTDVMHKSKLNTVKRLEN